MPAKVLVVDDDPLNVDLLEQALEEMGHATIAARDGQQALQAAFQHAPDLILLDVMMPILDGFEVLKQLKSRPPACDIPVIMISAMDDMNSVVRGIRMGAEDYLPKPFNEVLLRARIDACLEKKRLRDREAAHVTEIERQRRRADDLLHVILPPQIVAELKSRDAVTPILYPDVAIVFADVVGFTSYCNQLPPQEIVDQLQRMVRVCEELALHHGLQKIKTIGDAFMAAAGIFEPLDNSVLASVRCGLDMLRATAEATGGWKLRVGIHVGPVMGGIVGHRQYLFDVWGDTVNLAQRVESHGVAGTVNLSAEAWTRVAREFPDASSLVLEVKGKGWMELRSIGSGS